MEENTTKNNEEVTLWSNLDSKQKIKIFITPLICCLMIALSSLFSDGSILASNGLLKKDSISYLGRNGTAKAYVNVDSHTAKIDAKLNSLYRELGTNYNPKIYEKISDIYDVEDSVYCYIEGENHHLSNGDKIRVTCEYNTEKAIKNGVKYKSTSKEYTVSGLEEPINVNIFDGVNINWDIEDQKIVGRGTLESDDYFLNGLSFKATVKDRAVTITCLEDADNFAENGLHVSDENVQIDMDNHYYIETCSDSWTGQLDCVTGDSDIDKQIQELLDFEVYNFEEKNNFIIKDNYEKREAGIYGYAMTGFYQGEAAYTVSTSNGDYTLIFKPFIVLMPDGTVKGEDSYTLAKKLKGVVKYGDRLIS